MDKDVAERMYNFIRILREMGIKDIKDIPSNSLSKKEHKKFWVIK